jgi:hypothetical protein
MNMFDKLVIKDDFYADPMSVRRRALDCVYQEPPGASARLAKTAFCNEEETRAMCQNLQVYVAARDIVSVSVMFRYTLADTVKKTYCHVDGCAYAGIVYLTLPEHCAGGTTIYRHIETGDEMYDAKNAHLYNFRDESAWEIVREVEMVHNRLVFYPGQLFHALTPVFFGDAIENARLTQNVFIYRPGDPALGKLTKS